MPCAGPSVPPATARKDENEHRFAQSVRVVSNNAYRTAMMLDRTAHDESASAANGIADLARTAARQPLDSAECGKLFQDLTSFN